MLIRRATVDDAPAIARAHVRSWGETYRGIVPDAYIDALDPARREAFWRQELGKGHFALVTEKEGAVAGFADGGPFRGEPVGIPGELYAMYLLAAHHRKGIGTRLLKGVRTHLSGLGLMPFGARVLAQNPACRFYEAMGGRLHSEGLEEIGGVRRPTRLYEFG